MAKLLKLRRGTTSQHSSFTGAEGEVTVDTDKDVLVVNDGSTAGGHPLAAEDMSNVSSASITGRLGTGSIATAKIADAAITNAKLATNSVSQAKMLNDSVGTNEIVDGAVTTAKINDDAVTAAKIADDAINSDRLSNSAVSSAKLATNSVTTAKISDGNVTTAKIANDAVTEAKIANNAVSTNQLATSGITTAKIANDQITQDKMADNSVGTAQLRAGEVTTAKLAADCVTSGKIADDQINSEHYVNGSIDHVHLANDCIDSDNLQNDCVNSEHYVADSIDSEHYAPNSVNDDALSHTSVSAGSYGSSTSIPSFTVNAQGRITAASGNSVNTDLVGDSSPQLGGHLDTNNHNIAFTTGEKATWSATSGSGPQIFNSGSSSRDLHFNIDNAHKYTFHQNGILYQRGATSSNGGAYSSVAASYPVRAWLNYDDEDDVTHGKGNVSSIGDNGTGQFRINWGTNFPDTNYALVGMSGGSSGSRGDDNCVTTGNRADHTVGFVDIRTRKFTDNNMTNAEVTGFIAVR